jgi:tRNA A37 methylthiotransferase MiaB
VFSTCAVRENADNKLDGDLGHLKPVKHRTPGRQIAVGFGATCCPVQLPGDRMRV